MTFFGWSPTVFKLWYIVGALLGGAPLAQGTVWFLIRPRTARRLMVALLVVATIASACVIASPIDHAQVDEHLPSGRVLAWQWVRGFSPLLNTYAVIFLVGGALYSALYWRRKLGGKAEDSALARDRMFGNVLIAAGAMLPAAGGTAARAGSTEVLYVAELVGILLIWAGFWLNVRKRSDAVLEIADRGARDQRSGRWLPLDSDQT